jgi:integrase
MQEQLTNDFTYYWETIRPNLEHYFVFFNRGNSKNNFAHRGNPIPKHLSQLVKRIMYNASSEALREEQAKAMTPHDFRRSSATWFAHYGNIEDGFVFAQLHGHSVQMLLDLYAQVRSKEQTKQATSVFNRTTAREQALKQQGSEQDNRVWLKQFADRMSPETLAKVRAILETSFSA